MSSHQSRAAAGRTLHPASLWVVTGLAMGPAMALGLGRFAYALLLPSMRSDLGWSFADAGAMNTANAAGYLAGALAAAPLGRRAGDRRVFAIAMLATVVGIFASGLTAQFTALLSLRLFAGFTGALVFVTGAGLTSATAAGSSPTRSSTILGVYFAGGGLGITASALVIPPLLAQAGWRGGWMILGGMALFAAGWAMLALRYVPSPTQKAGGEANGGWSPRFMSRALLAYALFGAGYVAYATFIVAYLRSDEGFSSQSVSLFWATLGMASVIGAFAWAPVLGRLRGGWGLACTVGTVTLGSAVALLWDRPAGAVLSAILFGGSFLSVIAAVTVFARRAAQPHAWTAAIAALTIAFGLGQCIGPVLSGALSDGAAGVRGGLWLSVAILALAALVAVFQPEPEKQP